MVKERDHSALIVVSERGQLLDKLPMSLRIVLQVPCGLVADRTKTLLAAHFEDFQELRIHRLALLIWQSQPRREQLIRLGVLYGCKSRSPSSPRSWKYRANRAFGICRKKSLVVPRHAFSPVAEAWRSAIGLSRILLYIAHNIRNIALMRPINTMIEFKQIIGRGTRLYDGKDYFTIYDFVKAYLHFSDPEWDGEPLEPEPCQKCGYHPCQCVKASPQSCPTCGRLPCECPEEPCEVCGQRPCVCKKKTKAKVKLADGKERAIQHMVCTTFWHTDGTPISAQQFMELLFGRLPEFFKDEAELRALWSTPDTRAKLLHGLAEKGFG